MCLVDKEKKTLATNSDDQENVNHTQLIKTILCLLFSVIKTSRKQDSTDWISNRYAMDSVM